MGDTTSLSNSKKRRRQGLRSGGEINGQEKHGECNLVPSQRRRVVVLKARANLEIASISPKSLARYAASSLLSASSPVYPSLPQVAIENKAAFFILLFLPSPMGNAKAIEAKQSRGLDDPISRNGYVALGNRVAKSEKHQEMETLRECKEGSIVSLLSSSLCDPSQT